VGPTSKELEFFEQKVRPILVEHCYSCHSEKAKKLRGGLLLDSAAGWKKGGASGKPALVPGKPEESLLIQAVKQEGELSMPPGKKLPDAVIADLVAWVKMGAPDPRTGTRIEAKRADASWWSLQPLAEVQPPQAADAAWNDNPIDQFIFAKLAEQKLTPNPPAEPQALIRRMNYDLLGLPPTPEEVEQFVVAYRKNARLAVFALVERLLASPHYGERWGRHWLDVVRFGESNGFERNFLIDDLWPFRDFVIDSTNQDKPFNQFILEHLAGDVVGKGKPEVEVGSAFLVAGPFDDVGNQDAVAAANIRAATLDEIITATSSAFLGLTVNCARCHPHKFDPIPMEDYYRLRAAFEGVRHGRRVLATSRERTLYTLATQPLNETLTQLEGQRKQLEETIATRVKKQLEQRPFTRPKIDPQMTEEKFPAIEARYVRMVIHAHTGDPRKGSGASRLTEFEVWTAEPQPRNVALASNGGKAEGARSMHAEDYPEAYGPQLTIDGQHGEQWFIGEPAILTITLAKPEKIERIRFMNAKGKGIADPAQGATPCEYAIQVSNDGRTWKTVADSRDRIPWTPAHATERFRREVMTADETKDLAELEQRIGETKQKLARVPKLREVWAGNFEQPAQRTFVFQGGDPTKPGAAVLPSSLSVLQAVTRPFELPADASEGERRLALARWITSDNPLTARVLANRVWHYHFGTGLVDTPSDFGFLGSRPSHPELLEWLAGRLIEHGWRLKPLHREILLSRAYQQSAQFRAEAAAVDKEARWLWRFPSRRLSAEEVRDSMLFVAGQLDTRMGGPGFRLYKHSQNNVSTYFPLDTHGPETYRRAVYHQNVRASVVDVLSDFDLPDTAFSTPRRANTTTPLQALTLLNHRFTLDMAAAMSNRVMKATPGSEPANLVKAVYRLVFHRLPSEREQSAAIELVRQYGLPALCRALLNANEFLFVE
jgi:hypothetical protein